MSEDLAEYAILFIFEDQSLSFAHGFEMGKMYERMKKHELFFELMIHADNMTMTNKIAQHCGYSFVSWPAPGAEGEWIQCNFTYIGKEALDRQRLRVVPAPDTQS